MMGGLLLTNVCKEVSKPFVTDFRSVWDVFNVQRVKRVLFLHSK